MMRLPVVTVSSSSSSSVLFILIAFAVTLTAGFTTVHPVVITARSPPTLGQPWCCCAATTATSSSNDPNEQQQQQVATTTISSSSSSDDDDDDDGNPGPLIVVNGHNIDLTSSLVDYIQKRIGNILSKLAKNGAVRECDVVLSVSKNPKVKNGHKVEIVTNVKGTTIICKNESPDMYTSIDAGAHALQRKLVQYKERRTDGWHGGGSTSSSSSSSSSKDDDDEFTLALEETIQSNIQLLNDVKEPERTDLSESTTEVDDDPSRKVVKIQSFQLDKSISLDEAIFALDYVDHDFYVFRNAETNEINVIYKRHHGGIGLIEP